MPRRHDGAAWLRRLPNALTLARLLALPVLVWVLVEADGRTSPPAAGIFGAVAFTDFIDGKLARRLGAESRFGRIADPLADRLLVGVALVGVILLHRMSPIAPGILLARDLLIVLAFGLLLQRGVEMRVDMAGKVSSALTMVAAGGAILLDEPWVDALMWLAAALAVATFANYARIALGRLQTSTQR